MNTETLLLRQVPPGFIQEGRITSQVFRPTPKDENMLSTYNGDLISPADAWQHYTQSQLNKSVGVMAVSKGECDRNELNVIEDREPFPEHVSIDYSGKDRKCVERIAKILKTFAQERGWLFLTEDRGGKQ